MIFKSFWSSSPIDCEVIETPSMTIPDQSLSVREILARFTTGTMTVPPMDEGEDEDIDNAGVEHFDDIVDAYEAFNVGNEIYETHLNNAKESEKTAVSDTAVDTGSTTDTVVDSSDN